jgi:chromate transporter
VAGSLSGAPDPARAAPPRPPTRAEALRYWLRLGCISFGGPAGQIAIMHRELVEQRRWISEGRFLHALNYCMVLPGPEAQQLATYIGWLMHRTWGGIVAGALFVLPSLVVLVALSWLYVTYGNVPLVAAALYGVKPAVVAIVLHAAWRIGTRALRHPLLWVIAAMSFVAIFALHVPFPLIVLSAGLLGAVGGRVVPRAFARAPVHPAGVQPTASALIDDDTPTPAHALFAPRRLAAVVVVGLGLSGGTLGLLALMQPRTDTLFEMGVFFTKAALLTFGGAYAVLPYVFQGAVETYAWLTPAQMIDGLALGETTPGPLIMVVSFVGYVGASAKALFGTDARLAAGIAGACVATFFTFVPSFLFILAGGPLVERTHNQARFVAPLTGVTAAVVGVIVNLAVFFAAHVLWPGGVGLGADGGRSTDWIALAIGMAAALALFRARVGVIPVIFGAATAGVIARLAA